jgi:hypothetical protein
VLDEYYEFRRQVVSALERDVLGPGSPQELITDPPTTKYITGVLFPGDSNRVDPAQDLGEETEIDGESDDGESWDPAVSMSYVRYPSSMGMTVVVDTTAAQTITVSVGGARYVPVESETQAAETAAGPGAGAEPQVPQYFGRRAHRREQPAWRRVPADIAPIEIDLTKPAAGKTTPIDSGLELFQRIRSADGQGRVSVTLVLINTRKSSSGGAAYGNDADSFFQATLRAVAPGVAPVFVHRPNGAAHVPEEDVASDLLLYRDAVSMAVGHGTAVDWDTDQEDSAQATAVYTCMLPRYDLRLAESNPAIDASSLEMRHLAEAPRPDALGGLQNLCEEYGQWISRTTGQVAGLEQGLQATAERHLNRCRDALRRMQAGIELLARDSDAWEAFRLANKAMLTQRARAEWLASGDFTTAPDLNGSYRWRPFQMAFILLCLEGVANPDSPDRELADLLWFPTGGGKTEAYLGLLAFTAMLRRLRSPLKGHGVTVLMRYTLRLLTIQQFERAALLVCCLEAIRRADPRLGRQPIEIGLWVGQGATPNTLAEAKVSIDKLRQGIRIQEQNPLQLHRCPWCGKELGPRNLSIAASPRRLVIACRTEECAFSAGLPVCVVDDDIYARHPMLIIATSDKFASMPWRDACVSLFNGDLPGVRPPELIIQDELHLISGPLGTLAGLYETAVDLLCSAQGNKPKIIASTATIRRAYEQTMSLFDRDVRQFPPPGINAADSFFATEAAPAEKGTRLYIGVIAPGTSQTTLLVRTYAAILQAVSEIDGDPRIKDPYWTLVGYFNSLRVLGGARMQVQDDVDDRLDLLSRMHDAPPREIEHRIELTSRESSGDIPDHLRRMAISLPSPDTLDVILATNMISVGVDVNRLGLMAVMGQPQSTSEYIQATSRVGRAFPGLVVTMLNAAKSRDRSHYESFRDFHSALYRRVESSSVTPFSARARSRALHAVLIALARLTVPGLRANDSADKVGAMRASLQPAQAAILDRVRQVDAREVESTAAELEQIINEWVERAENEPDLVYSNRRHPDKALLGDAGIPFEDFQSTFPTLWSLRDVDRSSHLYQVN